MTRDHWFRIAHNTRPVTADTPCAYARCGRPRAEHVESVGEWRDPRHWFRPSLRRPTRCARCDRMPGHSTHHGSRKNRRLWHYDNALARLARKARRP